MTIERELLKRFMTELKTEEDVVSLFNDIKECLAQPKPTSEPVAWIIQTEIHGKLSEWICTDKKHYLEAHDSIKEPIPLYLAPPKRESLGLEIADVCGSEDYREGFKDGALYAEKAHGIGGEE